MKAETYQQQLTQLTPTKDYFVGIDSDGCVFDSMDIKHKECFTPAFIQHMELQRVSTLARETWDFVNLYSKSRGVNRFKALVLALDFLASRPEVSERNCTIPPMNGLRSWMERETKLGNLALREEIQRQPDPDLERAYAWSLSVNEAVEKIVWGLGPFPQAVRAIESLQNRADALVVSQTPLEALAREWEENSLDHLIRLIAGQEMGTKTEHIKLAAAGKYDPDKILMIGDAPGDLEAAKKNNALFFPIIPGMENQSWEELNKNGLDKFFQGSYAGEYEQELIQKFSASLPEKPSWRSL